MLRIIIVLLIFSMNMLLSQFKLSDWQAYTSMRNIQNVCTDAGNNIWAATTGGVFRYNPSSGETDEFRNVDNLLSINITEIYYDSKSDKIFTGSIDGILDIFYNNKWHHITDIYSSSQFSNKRINDIKTDGDIAYIAGGFGLAVFDVTHNIFLMNVERFGEFSQTTVNEVIFDNDSITIATNQGVAVAAKESFLYNPASWKSYGIESGFRVGDIIDIEKINDDIYALDEAGIYKFENGNFILVKEGRYFSLDQINNELLISGYSSIYNYTTQKNLYSFENLISGISVVNPNWILVKTSSEGLINFVDSIPHFIASNSPATNRFSDIDMQSDGTLWFATGDNSNGKGFMKYDGINWTNFNKSNRDDVFGNGYRRIVVNRNDRVFASGWGPGFSEIVRNDTGYKVITYDTTNTGLIGIGDDLSFLAMGDIEEDRWGNIWVVSYAELGTSGGFLAQFEEQSNTVNVYDNPYNPTYRNFFSLGIDMNDTKWIGGYRLAGTGLMYYNDKGTYEDKSDDIFGYITSSQETELLSNEHNAIETDMNGMVWIGTTNGLSVLLNPEAILYNSSLVFRKVNLVANTYINDIFVDELNNKWVASNDGVWILNSDASELLAKISKENSPLPDNTVLSVMVNPQDGRAYFGTGSGLYSAISLSAAPLNNYDISAYPQPYDPIKDDLLIIDGLSENSIIKIVTPSGEFISEIKSYGRKALWNGRDSNGNLVSNGVYLLIAQSVTNDKSSVAKIAVVRK